MSVFNDNFHLKKSHDVLVWNMIFFIVDGIICEFSHALSAACQNINFLQTQDQILGYTVHFDHKVKWTQLTTE